MATARIAEGAAQSGYERYQPEQTLLYRIVEEHYPTFRDLLEQQGRALPTYVQREFEEFQKCGRLENGFLRVRCDGVPHQLRQSFSHYYTQSAIALLDSLNDGVCWSGTQKIAT